MLTTEEMKAHQGQLLRDPDFDPTFDQFADFTTVTMADPSAQDIRDLAEKQVFSPTSKRAMVATKPFVFGLGRMFSSYHENRAEAQIFYNRDEALKWLGAPEDSGLF